MSIIDPSHVGQVVGLFQGRSFTTAEFVSQFAATHPNDWRLLVDRYGRGGAGGGSRYSANSYLALRLNDTRNRGTLTLLRYDVAPSGWGHERIAVWQ